MEQIPFLYLFYSHCFAAFTTLFISIAIVIGPTPPGTGDIYFTFGSKEEVI